MLGEDVVLVARCDRKGCKERRTNADVKDALRDARTPEGFACLLVSLGWTHDGREPVTVRHWYCPRCGPPAKASRKAEKAAPAAQPAAAVTE